VLLPSAECRKQSGGLRKAREVSRVPLNFGGGPHDRQAAITLSWPTSGAR